MFGETIKAMAIPVRLDFIIVTDYLLPDVVR
jgi:hypothetical protein